MSGAAAGQARQACRNGVPGAGQPRLRGRRRSRSPATEVQPQCRAVAQGVLCTLLCMLRVLTSYFFASPRRRSCGSIGHMASRTCAPTQPGLAQQ